MKSSGALPIVLLFLVLSNHVAIARKSIISSTATTTASSLRRTRNTISSSTSSGITSPPRRRAFHNTNINTHHRTMNANININSNSNSNSNSNNITNRRDERNTRNVLKIRRGGELPQSSTYWSTKPNTNQKQPYTTGSNMNNSNNRYLSPRVTVSDITDELKDQQNQEVKEELNAFLTRENRNTFIVRVYAILTTQLLITVASIFSFEKNPMLTKWMISKGRIIPMVCLLFSTISVSIMSFSENARRSSPMKWQLLTLFTVCEAVVVGMISSFYRSKTVISALLSTALATVSVTGYTLLNKNPKYDLSQWGAGLSSIGMIFVFYGLIQFLSSIGWLPPGFLPYNDVIYSMLGTSLFTMYLAYHTRLIVSGKHTKYQLNEKDYVFGAVLLYNDIINIFLYLLRLLENDDR